MKKCLLIPPLALLMAACATTQTTEAPVPAPAKAAADTMAVSAAITAAETAADKADAVGYQWRDTASLIDGAKKAAAANDSAKALDLAGQALRQSENAIKQQAAQQDAGSHI